MINVDWSDVRSYAKWLSAMTGKACRLPGEAEWEYAARADTTTLFPWGNEAGLGRGNFSESGSAWSGQQTAPARSFPANRWGLYDVSGNVYEWVEDCWHDSYKGAPVDGRPWGRDADDRRKCSRVLRGGSWSSDAEAARSAARISNFPGAHIDSIGFRVLCSSSIE